MGAAAAKVLERTRAQWSRQAMDLRKDALTELQHVTEWADLASWADISQAQRMLKANIGDVSKAVDMFLQALELRARHRDLYERLVCEVRCDMRIIGHDIQEHPVVYMCAGSQTEPLRSMMNQFVVTFEAACQLASGRSEGR